MGKQVETTVLDEGSSSGDSHGFYQRGVSQQACGESTNEDGQRVDSIGCHTPI